MVQTSGYCASFGPSTNQDLIKIPPAGAEQLATQLSEVELVFERKVGENEHLFGSVTSGDIAHQLEAKGFTIDRRKIALDDPLKTIGEYHVPVKLHREVTSHVKVTVKGDQPEAEEVATAATT